MRADLDGVTEEELVGVRARLARRTRIDAASGCWIWFGSLGCDGYGQFHLRGRANGWLDKAHRASYRSHVGPLGGMCVLHRCDNPPCINPVHLFLGSRADNIADMLHKGRGVHLPGVKNGRAKLSEEQASCALHRARNGEGVVSISRDYGVTPAAIGHIVTGKNWKHIVRTGT